MCRARSWCAFLVLWTATTASVTLAVEPVEIRLDGLTLDEFRRQNPTFEITFLTPHAERKNGVEFVPAAVLESWYQMPVLYGTDEFGRQRAMFSGTTRFGETAISVVCTEDQEQYTVSVGEGTSETLRFPPNARCYVNEYGDFMVPALPIVRAIGGRAFVKEGQLHLTHTTQGPVPPADQPVAAASPETVLPPLPAQPAQAPETPTGVTEDYFLLTQAPQIYGATEENPTPFVLRQFITPSRVEPDAPMDIVLEWEYRYPVVGDYDSGATVFITLLGDWQPLAPLKEIVAGERLGEPRVQRQTVRITAPPTPGVYRMRWVAALASAPVRRFFGEPSVGEHSPGVGPYGEVTFEVIPPISQQFATPAPTTRPTDTPVLMEVGPTPTEEPPDYFRISRQPQLWPAPGTPGLNVAVLDFEVAGATRPGATAAARVVWEYRRGNVPYRDDTIVSISLLGNWTDKPLAVLQRGLPLGPPSRYAREIAFDVPDKPGEYRLRWVLVWGYEPAHTFYGAPPGPVEDPGVGPYAEVSFRVGTEHTPTPAPTEPLSVPTESGPAAATGVDWFVRTNAIRLLPPNRPNTTTVALESFSVPERVRPGEHVQGRVDWEFRRPPQGDYDPNRSVFVVIFGDWQPDTPLAVLINGSKQGAPRWVRKFFFFDAPTTPGTYRLRWVLSWGIRPVERYYGADPETRPPGVGPYAEATFVVE